jgi:transposase
MFTVELYAGIRRAVMVDGLSRREAAKRFGVHRNTITKMLQAPGDLARPVLHDHRAHAGGHIRVLAVAAGAL